MTIKWFNTTSSTNLKQQHQQQLESINYIKSDNIDGVKRTFFGNSRLTSETHYKVG